MSDITNDDLHRRFMLAHEFLSGLKARLRDEYIEPCFINWGFNADGDWDQSEIDLEWDEPWMHGMITMGDDGAGIYAVWNDKSHHIKMDWTGSLWKDRENQNKADEMYRFFLRGLDKRLKKPVEKKERVP